MIIAKIFGGLGNQMFQYAAAFALAKRSNSTLKLDISAIEKPDAHSRIFGLNHFSISAQLATTEEVEVFLKNKTTFLKQTKYLQRKLGITLNNQYWYQQYIYETLFDKQFIKGTNKDVYLEGYWATKLSFRLI